MFSHSLSTSHIISAWPRRFLNSFLSLLADSERLGLLAELFLVVVLAWCHIDITYFHERRWPGRGLTHLYIRLFVLSQRLSTLRRVGPRTHALLDFL